MEENEKKFIPLDDKEIGKDAKRASKFFKDEIIGQERAIELLVEIVETAKSPLRDRNCPIFVSLLLGPTGVGKTFTPETLAKFLFGDPRAVTAIDCSNFVAEHQVSLLFGSPPGYVGFNDNKSQESKKSAYPILSQWNIDKHHHEFLERLHKKEIEKVVEEYEELRSINWINSELGKEIRELSDEINNKKKETVKLELGKPNMPNRGVQEKIVDLKSEITILEVDREERSRELSENLKGFLERREKVDKKLAEMSRAGWIYDLDNPPQNLFSIIIFDEIEKANPAFFNVLLEIMDKGCLSLANGELTSFKNSFIFLTSNLGSRAIAEHISGGKHMGFQTHNRHEVDFEEFDDNAIYKVGIEGVGEKFPPEFVGRIDEIIVFRPLKREHFLKIFDVIMRDLDTFLAKNLPFLLKIDKEVKNFIVDRAMRKKEFGTRMLKRRFEKYIKRRLTRLLNSGQIQIADTILVKLEEIGGEKRIKFYKEEREPST